MTKLQNLCGVSVLALSIAGVAQAQEKPELEEVIVTGSRIARADYVAESPIVTVTAETLAARGPVTIDNTFNTMPQFVASNATSGTSPARQGRNNANLRGLGIQRTLVLLDGRRTQPSDAAGAVDLNSITPALIENIEIITGGASAIYGSDAIAGVVNFKLRKNFNGLELDAQYGITERNDNEGISLAATIGTNFPDDRGNVTASLTWFDRGATLRDSRPFFDRTAVASALSGGAFIANASNLPTQAAINAVYTRYGATSFPARNASMAVNADRTLFTTTAPVLNYRFTDGDPYILDQGRVGFPLGPGIPLQTPIERRTAFVQGNYKITDHVEAYTHFNYMRYDTTYGRQGWSAGSATPIALIPVTNPFIPADMRAILASRPNPNAPVNFTFSTSRIGRTAYRFFYDLTETLVGLRGDIPGLDWTWDVYGTYGTTDASETTSGWVNVAAWNALVNAADGGATICPGGFNPFLPGSLEDTPGQERCHEYLNRTLTETTEFRQKIAEASLQGGLFDLPAGEVRFAAGASYRKQTYSYRPPGERIRSEVWPVQITGNTDGSYNVKEVFGEVVVPLLKDLPFIEALNVDVAARYSDYNLAGGISTYKASLDWVTVEGLRFRGGYQRAIRAPSLGELFSPPERASAGVGSTTTGGGDPCDSLGNLRNPSRNPNAARVRALCIAQGVPTSVVDIFRFAGSSVGGVAGGNTDLKPETADTYTAGVVWQSQFEDPLLRRLQVSLDYFHINVDDAIGVVSAGQGVNRCFNEDGVSNPTYTLDNFYCRLTTRNANGSIEQQITPTLNLARYQTSGIDFQLDWGFDLEDVGLGDRGSLAFNVLLSKRLTYKIQSLEGAPFLDFAGTTGNSSIDAGASSHPEWKASITTLYRRGPLDLSVNWRWTDNMDAAGNVGVVNPTGRGVKARDYVDISGAWKFTENTVVRAGVQNVFDRPPPSVGLNQGNTDSALFDILQRRYFIGVKQRF